jgi:hypothetical protein
MQVSVWKGSGNTYGFRVGERNRQLFFNDAWKDIDVEIDGQFHRFRLSGGFWNDCPHFQTSETFKVGEWLKQRGLLPYTAKQTPKFELLPLGGRRFRLLFKAE